MWHKSKSDKDLWLMLEWVIQFIIWGLNWLILQPDISIKSCLQICIWHFDVACCCKQNSKGATQQWVTKQVNLIEDIKWNVGVNSQMCSLRHPSFPLRPICNALSSDAISMGVGPWTQPGYMLRQTLEYACKVFFCIVSSKYARHCKRINILHTSGQLRRTADQWKKVLIKSFLESYNYKKFNLT